MKKIFTILFIGFSLIIQAQNKISGIISTHLNEPISGAQIYIEELGKGTSSNEIGFYELSNLPNNPVKITVSFIGFETKIITISPSKTENTLNVILMDAIFHMDEIIISTPFNKLQSENVVKIERASLQQLKNKGASTLAEGITTIYNAACEPYLQQLCKMLNSMGAKIRGVGSNLLIIEGVEVLGGCSHRILPDMIEIGSWIGMAAMTKSSITIKNVSWDDLGLIPRVFQKIGIKLERRGDDIFIPEQDSYEIQNFIDGSILTVSDAPWPGFTPDLLSIILVVATQAKGSVLIHQKMFESRLFFVDKLIDMGAKVILCDPHRATVIGMDHEFSLKATTMTSPDIRAGISLLIAALSATGTSTIHNIEQIDRGYQNIDTRLRAIGAKITRID